MTSIHTWVGSPGSRAGPSFLGMFRLPATCAVAITFAACGATAAPPKPASQAVGSLRLMKPPLLLYHDKDAYLSVWVRLNRPIKSSDIRPDENGDRVASLEALDAEHIGGMEPNVRYPTCYEVALDVGEPPAVGQPVEVELKLGPAQTITATGTMQRYTSDAHPERQLGCPRDPNGHLCRGDVTGTHLTISLWTAYRTSCRVTRAVMESVGVWADPRRCPCQLCVTRHRMNHGYRCEVALDNGGESPPRGTSIH